MRIAVVEFAGRGGLIHYAYQLCRALAAAGASPTLVTSQTYELEALTHPFPVERLLRLWDPKPPGRPVALVRGRRLARRTARAVRHYREWLRLIAWLRRRDFDVVQLGDIRFAADVACVALLRLLGMRVADVCHNVLPFALRGPLVRQGGLVRALYRRLYGMCAVVFVHYQSGREAFERVYGPQRVVAIPHGNESLLGELRDPELDAPALRRRLGLAGDEPVVLLFGTLTRYKGTDLAVAALPLIATRHPKARLVLAGFPASDFDEAGHGEMARTLGVEDRLLIEPRYLESDEVAAWMEMAAVAIFPYRTVFQSGAVHLAQTFGVPLVASRVGAMAEVVEDGRDGLLVPPDDAPALAEAVSALLADRSRAQALGRAAAHAARTRFGWDRVAQAVLEGYPA